VGVGVVGGFWWVWVGGGVVLWGWVGVVVERGGGGGRVRVLYQR